MILHVFEIISIFLLMLVGGLYWGPWLALSRSMSAFEPSVFLAVVKKMTKNMEPIMTILVPIALVSTIPVLFLSYGDHRLTFYTTLIALLLFIVTLVVTMLVEVPIAKKITTWTVSTLPDNWQQLRDRWGSFHYFRVFPAIIGLVVFLIGAIL